MYLHSSGMHKKIINEQKLTKISHNPKNNVISKIAPKTCTRNTPFFAKNTFDTDGDAPKAKVAQPQKSVLKNAS